jgi:two-component system LytT family response regulator
MKTLLIDDEPIARAELRRLLVPHTNLHVVAEAEDYSTALAAIRHHAPDLVFLDIQLPGRTGFDLLELLPPPHPRVIFVTAHDHFALRAFRAGALDYLLKPLDPLHLDQALAKVTPSAAAFATTASAPPTRPDHVFLRDGDECWFVPLSDIALLELDGNHTRFYLPDRATLQPRALAELEARLPPGRFLRANRTQIVNLSAIKTVRPWFSGGLRVTLTHPGAPAIEFSRRQARLFREHFSL